MTAFQKYKFKPYDFVYPKLFEKEKKRLAKILPKYTVIEHVGSSAVPGLGGKGIIDIAIKIPKSKINAPLKLLQKNGYIYDPHPGDESRKFLERRILAKGKERRVHLHLTWSDGGFWDGLILFRDYLRSNKKARNEYAKVKKEAAKHAQGDKDKYRKHKEKVIQKLFQEAIKK